jgi:hypothetical protein
MRVRVRKEKGLIQFFDTSPKYLGEVAYIVTRPRGLQAEIEFPSDWHETARGWVRLGFGLFTVAFSFPWSKVVPDEYQCSGPRYGFTFFDTGLHLHWGKSRGLRSDPSKIVNMPWAWRHKEHRILSEKETHPYRYVLRSGEVQERTATINAEQRTWVRPWLPWKLVRKSINIEFSDEVGERSGSWKGGTVGCSYEMNPGETPLDALRRMEKERKF